jgi:hypothetical protein
MAWPSGTAGTTNIDAGTDSPAAARADLKDALDKLNLIIGHVSAFAQTLLDDPTAATARTTLGAAAAGLLDSSGVTIAQNRIAGRTAAGTGALEALTGAQVTALLSAATESAQGAVELASAAELQAGTDPGKPPSVEALRAGLMVQMPMQATTSGSQKDFSGIPSWASAIVVQLDRVSSNGAGAIYIQLGDSGGLEPAGYASTSGGGVDANSVTAEASASGIYLFDAAAGSAPNGYTGSIMLTRMDEATNKWSVFGVVATGNATPGIYMVASVKELNAALSQVSLITANTFDAGNVALRYW